MHEKDYTKENAKTIDQWVEEGWIWGTPISHEVYEKAVKGEWGHGADADKAGSKVLVSGIKGEEDSGACFRRRSADADFCGAGRNLYGA